MKSKSGSYNNNCRFSLSISSPKALSCADLFCLTPFHPGFVSRSVSFPNGSRGKGGMCPGPFKTQDRRLVRRFVTVTGLLTTRTPARGISERASCQSARVPTCFCGPTALKVFTADDCRMIPDDSRSISMNKSTTVYGVTIPSTSPLPGPAKNPPKAVRTEAHWRFGDTPGCHAV